MGLWIKNCLAIGVAGFFGAIARFAVAQLFGRLFATGFPLGTLFINVSGSFFLGWFLTSIGDRYQVSDTIRLAVATGFVGAYTTFSTYMWESNALATKGAIYQSMTNVVFSVVLGLLAVRLGIAMAHRA
jgi:CrcB protein